MKDNIKPMNLASLPGIPGAIISVFIGCVLVLVNPVEGQIVHLDFYELPTQPIDGLSYQGVTFDFKVGGSDSTEAEYNSSSGFGSSAVFLDFPMLGGNAQGVLTLDFASPTNVLQFGIGRLNPVPQDPECTVELFDQSLNSIGVFYVNMLPLIGITEGQFLYYWTPIKRAVIDFGFDDGEFLLDNLEFNTIPEPGTLLLLALGGLALRSRRAD